jgi:exoribonuclease II
MINGQVGYDEAVYIHQIRQGKLRAIHAVIKPTTYAQNSKENSVDTALLHEILFNFI